MAENLKGFTTRAVHAGDVRPLKDGAVNIPIYQSSTYETPALGSGGAVRYMRMSNSPNHEQVAQKICALEGAEAAVVTASGMAAVSAALIAAVGHGEHLIVQEDLYGGTLRFLLTDFPKMGREVTFVPFEEIANPKAYLKPNTKAIYCESVSNPLLKVPDLRGVVAFAKANGLHSLIDNTFPSPYNFAPAAIGFDLIIHSATKYLNGHSDIVGGFVVGKQELVKATCEFLCRVGACMDVHSCFLLNRGMKTLSLRMRAHNENAARFAAAMSEQKRVSEVFYPGLKSHPHHTRATALFRGYGGMVSLRVDATAAQIDDMFRQLRFAISAPSLGGVETLVTRPVMTSHYGLSQREYEMMGISENLVRVSVGIEDVDDLVEDFLRVLR